MSGSVEVGELVPVIFNKASSPQHHLIRHLIEYENAMVRDQAANAPRGGGHAKVSNAWHWRSGRDNVVCLAFLLP